LNGWAPEGDAGLSEAAALAIPVEQAQLPAGHPWTRLPLAGVGLALVGLAALAVLGPRDPARFFGAWLVAFAYFLSLALGCLYFVLIHTAMQGAWGVVVRRLAETAAATLPLFALLFLPVALGLHHLYPWSGPHAASDPLVAWKRPFLNEGFFYARAAAYFVVWSVIALLVLRTSCRQDAAPDPTAAARLRRFSGPALIPLGVTHTFAAVDWLMSLDPHWYSTMFGVYAFSGALVAAFALLGVLAASARRSGLLHGLLSAEHFHDIGKLIFAFTAFWAYIGFSQYFLIWYGNLPEETVWFRHRLEGGFGDITLLLAIGHFAVPFCFFLPRAVKRSGNALILGGAWVLLMHLLDVYWLVMPSLHGQPARPGLLDGAALLAVGGTCLAAFGWLLSRHALVPVGDPRLVESLSFENV
jgi:hypothetical protein